MGQHKPPADTRRPSRPPRKPRDVGRRGNPTEFDRELRRAIGTQDLVTLWTTVEEEALKCNIKYVDQYFIKVEMANFDKAIEWINKSHIVRLRISRNGGGS